MKKTIIILPGDLDNWKKGDPRCKYPVTSIVEIHGLPDTSFIKNGSLGKVMGNRYIDGEGWYLLRVEGDEKIFEKKLPDMLISSGNDGEEIETMKVIRFEERYLKEA